MGAAAICTISVRGRLGKNHLKEIAAIKMISTTSAINLSTAEEEVLKANEKDQLGGKTWHLQLQ